MRQLEGTNSNMSGEETELDSCLIPGYGRMNVGVAHSEVKPNT